MKRRGVVVLSGDRSTAAFVDDILAEMLPAEPRSIRLRRARTCIAAVSAPVWRRLLIIDGEPPDLNASVLIESVKLSDPELPIVLVRHGWTRQPVVHDAVRVCPGPFVSRAIQALIIDLLVPRQ